jgi:hypothetical protein
LNPVRHGLTTAKAVVITEIEKLEHYEAFRAEMLGDLAPVGPLEMELVDEITSISWRLKRIPRYERAVVVDQMRCAAQSMNAADTVPSPIEGVSPPPPPPRSRWLIPEVYDLDKVIRYETHLVRTRHKLLHDLLALQKRGHLGTD